MEQTIGDDLNKKLDGYEKQLKNILNIDESNNVNITCKYNEQNQIIVTVEGVNKYKSFINKVTYIPIFDTSIIKIIQFKKLSFDANANIFKIFILFSQEYNNLYSDEEIMVFKKYITKNSFNISKSIVFEECAITTKINVVRNIHFDNVISFERCHFTYNLIFNNSIFNNGIMLLHCTYNKNVIFENMSLRYFPIIDIDEDYDFELQFKNVDFENKVMLYRNKINTIKKISFESVIFKKELHLRRKFNCKYKKLNFKNVQFYSVMKFINLSFLENIDLENIIFHSAVGFDGSIIKDNKFILKYMIFKDQVQLLGGKEFEDVCIEFENLHFEKNLKLDDLYQGNEMLNQKLLITDCVFDGAFQFFNINFQKEIEIVKCVFNDEVSFYNNTFSDIFKFTSNTIRDSIHFIECNFEIQPHFNSTVFEKVLNLGGTSFKQIPSFATAVFTSSAVFNINGIKIGINSLEEIKTMISIKLKSVSKEDIDIALNKLKPYKTMYKTKIEQLKYTKENKPKLELSLFEDIRNTYKIFKDTFLKTNNVLEASKYKLLELYAKELELDYKLEHEKELEEKITIKERFDRWFLKLNRATSDHHTDFLKILLFTLSVIGGYFMIIFGLSFDEKIISNICDFKDLGLVAYSVSIVIFFFCFIYEYFKGFNKYKKSLICIFLVMCLLCFCLLYSVDTSVFSVFLLMIFIGILAMLFILLANNVKYTFISFAAAGFIGILCTPSIITSFLGAFSEDARNHYLYKAIDKLDDKKALELARIILPNDKDLKEFEPSKTILSKNAKLEQISIFDKTDLSVNLIYEQSNQDKNEQSIYKAKKTLKDYKDELKSSKLLNESPELKRAVAIDGGVSRLNIAYYLVLAFCIFALQKTMRKNSIIPS